MTALWFDRRCKKIVAADYRRSAYRVQQPVRQSVAIESEE